MKQEGLLVGGSSGSALGGALAWFKTEAGKKIADTEGVNVVVLLPDGWVSLCYLGLDPRKIGRLTTQSPIGSGITSEKSGSLIWH